jgi:hypothetical protein
MTQAQQKKTAAAAQPGGSAEFAALHLPVMTGR